MVVPDDKPAKAKTEAGSIRFRSIKKAKQTASDDLRPEHRREDFGPMVRGKYAARLKTASNVVDLKPEVAKVFPNANAVNDALNRDRRVDQTADPVQIAATNRKSVGVIAPSESNTTGRAGGLNC